MLDELGVDAAPHTELAPFWAIIEGADLELGEDRPPPSAMVSHVDGEDKNVYHRPYDYSDVVFDDDEEDYDDPNDQDYDPYSDEAGNDVLDFDLDEQIPEPVPPPVAPRLMTVREAFRYADSLPKVSASGECLICFHDFQKKIPGVDMTAALTLCNHVFCIYCLVDSLEVKLQCPMCRGLLG